MILSEICRACLRDSGTMCSLFNSIKPKLDSLPDAVVDMWNIYTTILMSSENRFPDHICSDCINEIHGTYSFMLKCQRSENILKKLKDVKICLKRLKIIIKCENEGEVHTKSRNDMFPLISIPKNENIEYDETVNKISKDTLIDQHFVEFDSLPIHLDCANNVPTKEVAIVTQYVKQEPDLDILDEEDGFESTTAVLDGQGSAIKCRMVASLEKNKNSNYIKEQLCKRCNKEFNGRTIHHCPKRIRKFVHPCSICSKMFQQKCHLNRHLESHARKIIHKCSVCLKIFQQKSRLKRHFEGHTGEKPFKCESCPRVFLRKNSLKQHLRCHTGERPFKCDICFKTYRYKNSLVNHLGCHTKESIFKCEICPKAFRYKNGLWNHKRIRHPGESAQKNRHNCGACSKICKDKNALMVHMRIHTGEMPYPCEFCSKKFRYKTVLNTHIALNHATECASENLYKCSICSKYFAHESNLLIHMRTHTKENPYTCRICSKKFRYKHYLRTHIIEQHAVVEGTDERLYKCEKCSKVFAQKSRLRDHLRSHTSGRFFKCKICPKDFRYAHILRNHMRVVHRECDIKSENVEPLAARVSESLTEREEIDVKHIKDDD